MEDLQLGDFEYSESVEETYERFTKSMSVNEERSLSMDHPDTKIAISQATV